MPLSSNALLQVSRYSVVSVSSSPHSTMSSANIINPGTSFLTSSVNTCSAISSHHCSTCSVVASYMFDSLSTRFLRNLSFVSSSFSFHHLIRFFPAALRCLVFVSIRSAISILCCVVIASEGSTLQFLHSLACSFLNMI